MRSPPRTHPSQHQLIHIHQQAPSKPPMGAPCNGCGLCCLAEPCPLGVLLSRSRSGPCTALRWDAQARQYRCGALDAGAWPRPLAGIKARLVLRWIAAGAGCDCDLEMPSSPTISLCAPSDPSP